MKFSRTYAVFLITLFSILGLTRTVEAAYPLGSEVVFYHFEDAATATSTNSGSSGASNDGTLVGAASTTAALTKFGSRSLSLGETGDYMRTYYGNGVNPTTQSISVSLWVYKGSNTCSGDDDHIFGVSGSPTANRFYIRCSASKWAYRIQGNAQVSSTNNASTTGWDHIVLVANSSTDQASFYLNGVAQGAAVSYTSFTLPGHFYVGNYNDTVGGVTTEGAGAFIDEVAIYSTALTPSDVNELYQAGQVGAAVSSLAATGYNQNAYLSWTAGAGTTTDFLVEYKLSSEPTTWTVFFNDSKYYRNRSNKWIIIRLPCDPSKQ